jgi:hypothetical protein
MGIHIGWLTIDCGDERKVAEFWEQVLPSKRIYEEDGEIVLLTQDGGWKILFYKVEGDKKVKNRLHLDLVPDDQEAEVARLEGLGATRVDIGQKDVSWVVMADVEGNEFCVLRAGADQ